MFLSGKKGNHNILGRVSNFAVFFVFTAFSFLTFSLLSPIVSSNAQDSSASAGSSAYVASISANNSVSLSATPTNTQTVFSGTNTITYTNTCPYGFNVTISSSSSDTNLTRVGTDSGLKTIPTISSGTALGNNTWGYSIDSGSTYNPIPALATPTNIINTSTATTNPATLNVLYGVKINNTIPSGDYSNDVVYTVSVKPQCLTYTLSFDLDNGTGATGVDYSDQVLNYGQTIDLTTYTPTKSGYDFDGWSNGTDTFTGSETNADVNPSNSPAITLTAQWVSSLSTMQEFSCSSLQAGGTTILLDARDNNTYHVRKLADGKCWMTDNLKLGKDDDTMTLHPSDSNVSSDFVLPVSDISATGFSTVDDKALYLGSDSGYYNFYTATAGTGGTSLTSGNASSSICPKGWRLPTGGVSGEFKALYDRYNTVSALMNDPGFVGAGRVGNLTNNWGYYWSSTVPSGSSAYYLYLNTNGSDINPGTDYYGKQNGYSVRCVAIETIHTISNMQDMTPSVCAETTKPLTSATRFDTDGSHHGDDTYVPRARLKDTRDGNYYLVSKLADGNCWMSQNLGLILEQDEPVVTSNNDGTTGSFTPENSTRTTGGSGFSNDAAGSYAPVLGASGSYFQNGITSSDSSSHPDDDNYDWEKTGVYYNWYAATGGTGTASMTSADASSSICPKGWRLPPQTGARSYDNLITTTYGISSGQTLVAAPFNFLVAGMYREYGSMYTTGQVGNYWQSTASGFASEADKLQINYNFYGYSVYPTNTSMGKNMGTSVRCVAI